jgi:hypothetical protein
LTPCLARETIGVEGNNMSANKHPMSNRELEQEVKRTRGFSTASLVVAFTLGGGGVFGVMQYIDKAPFEKSATQADVDKKDIDARLALADAQIKTLEQQLADARASGDKSAENTYSQKLASAHSALESEIEQIRARLNELKSNGEGWYRTSGPQTANDALQRLQHVHDALVR